MEADQGRCQSCKRCHTEHITRAFQKKVAKYKEESEEQFYFLHYYCQYTNSKSDVFIFSQIDHTAQLISHNTTEFSDLNSAGNKQGDDTQSYQQQKTPHLK